MEQRRFVTKGGVLPRVQPARPCSTAKLSYFLRASVLSSFLLHQPHSLLESSLSFSPSLPFLHLVRSSRSFPSLARGRRRWGCHSSSKLERSFILGIESAVHGDRRRMSSGEIRKVSRQDIQLVQNLIERCLQLYMNQKEVVDTLLYQAKIEPGFTELVWQKLEEENRDFFKAYHVRLMLKNQILVFNKLLEKQVELMNKVCSSGVGSGPISHGSGSSTLNRNPRCYLSENASTSRPDGLLSNGGSSSATINDGPAVNQNVHLGNGSSTFGGRLDVPTSLLSSKNSLMGRDHMMNGSTIKTEPSYTTNSEFAFSGSSFLETHPTLGDPLGASFSGTELTAQALNEPLQDIDSSPYGFLSQIPRNFSFSDLTDGFAQSAGILENYSRSPYLAAEANNFTESPGVDCNEEERRLDTISEGVSYDEFGSD